MSVTFSGAFTFTGGGFTASLAPPPSVATAGWFVGGGPGGSQSNVQRIIFATDTATASARGPLSAATRYEAGTGTFTDGWFAGGAAPSFSSTVQRITYTTDTATASVRGPLSSARYSVAGSSDGTTYGWFAGGFGPISTIDRITFASDTATATVRGPLSAGRNYIAATGTSTEGWFGGGNMPAVPAPTGVSIVSRVTYATDTATASVRGPLSLARRGAAASTDSSTYGWFGSGAPITSVVDRITYATDTTTASVRGPLSLARQYLAASCDNTNGWFGGGLDPNVGGGVTVIDRITYATDTATASVRGPLAVARQSLAASSGIQ